MARKKLIKTTRDLVGSGVLLSAGASVVGKLPSAPTGVGTGFTTMGKFFPLFATAGAMGVVTNQLKSVKWKKKKKKR